MSEIAGQSRRITPDGFERLQAHLELLMTVRRTEVARWLRDACDDGGAPDENLDRAQALAEHARLEGQISNLQHRLGSARIVDYVANGTADIGAHVHLRMPDGRTMRFQLVGVAEADPAQRRLSIESPVGRAIRGRREGDVVDADTPVGAQRVQIVEIEGTAVPLAA